MNIAFFSKNGVIDPDAIGAGIYQFKIGLSTDNCENYKSLYIGESYSMVVRCSNHIYEVFHNDPAYFGLTVDHLSNNMLTLAVEVYEHVVIPAVTSYSDRDVILREREMAAINECHPLSQQPSSDNLRKDRVEVVGDALKHLLELYI